MVKFIKNLLVISIGATLAAFSLECFLVPNKIIDGGIVGVSMMLSTITKYPLGLFTFCLNLPFIFLALQKFGKTFVINTFWAISILSLSLSLFHHHIATNDAILATVFGGIILGLGVGLILKSHAAVDGTEIIAIRLTKKIGYSVGEIIMFINIFIYTLSGFLYGFDRAMYSILTYFIVYHIIDMTIEGFNEAKSVFIVTDYAKLIGDALLKELDKGVTYIDAEGGYSGKAKRIVYCVISRMELVKLKSLVHEIDENAFIAVENVHEFEGKRYRKK